MKILLILTSLIIYSGCKDSLEEETSDKNKDKVEKIEVPVNPIDADATVKQEKELPPSAVRYYLTKSEIPKCDDALEGIVIGIGIANNKANLLLCRKFNWVSLNFEGKKGEQGEDGIQGEQGEDGIQGKRGEKGDKGVEGKQFGMHVKSVNPGSANCRYGGQSFQSFEDRNKDGVYGFQDELIGVASFVCNGKDGNDGQNGKDGQDGTNGKDGIDGKDGKDGKSISAAKFDLAAPHELCQEGGKRIVLYMDQDLDKSYSEEKDEFVDDVIVCNGINAEQISVQIEEYNRYLADCDKPKVIFTYLDKNKNNEFDTGDEKTGTPNYICDGQKGFDSLIKTEDAFAEGGCDYRAFKITNVLDTNRNKKVDDSDELIDTKYTCLPASLPDLKVTKVVPNNNSDGLMITVKNSSHVASNASFKFLILDNTSKNEFRSGSKAVPSQANSATPFEKTFNVNLVDSLKGNNLPKFLNLTITIDPDETVTEENESNNVFNSEIQMYFHVLRQKHYYEYSGDIYRFNKFKSLGKDENLNGKGCDTQLTYNKKDNHIYCMKGDKILRVGPTGTTLIVELKNHDYDIGWIDAIVYHQEQDLFYIFSHSGDNPVYTYELNSDKLVKLEQRFRYDPRTAVKAGDTFWVQTATFPNVYYGYNPNETRITTKYFEKKLGQFLSYHVHLQYFNGEVLAYAFNKIYSIDFVKAKLTQSSDSTILPNNKFACLSTFERTGASCTGNILAQGTSENKYVGYSTTKCNDGGQNFINKCCEVSKNPLYDAAKVASGESTEKEYAWNLTDGSVDLNVQVPESRAGICIPVH